jgi:hypothetical protein
MGYVRPALPVLTHFQQRGAKVLAALKNTTNNADILHSAGFSCVQAPTNMNVSGRADEDMWAYVDLLHAAGFGHVPTMIGLVHGWRGLFELSGATTVLAHHSPAAMLAARTMNLPAQRIGTGFACPPKQSTSKSFLPWAPVEQALTRNRALDLLDNINQVLTFFGATEVDSIDASLAGNVDDGRDWLISYPELDHYAGRDSQSARFLGTIAAPTTDGKENALKIISEFDGVFAYVHPDFPDIVALIEGLKKVAKIGVKIAIFASGLGEATFRQWMASAPSSFSVLQKMVSLPEMLASARLMVSHGSHGVTSAALLAGVPCLVFPRNADQWMLGAALERLGAGNSHTGKLNAATAAKLINEAMSSSTLRGAARQFCNAHSPAGAHSTHTPLTTLDDVWQIMGHGK